MKNRQQTNVANTSHRTTQTIALIAAALAMLAGQPKAAAQPQFTSLYSFNGSDGFGPMAGVIQGADGALYGTTTLGGGGLGGGLGTAFRLDRTTLALTTLHTFTGGDGATLYSGLSQGSDGLLYGSTFGGGVSDLGTLFRVGPDGQNFASLYNFTGPDGARPDDLKMTQGGDGAFYGATSEAGPDGGGTLFRFDPVTQGLTTLYAFIPVLGGGVDAGLVAGRDGFWYGTTYSGGAAGGGSIFRLDPATMIPMTLHDFTGPDGQNPVPGSLMQGSDGNLYGTTQLGGYGTVFKLDPTTLTLTTLHVFSGLLDGRYPLGGVTEGGDGYLYGTTALGGQGYGTVYRVNPTTLAYNTVIPFGNSNGRMPTGNLLRAADGAIYGTTRVGGTFNGGTVFRLSFADTTPPTINSITATPSVLRHGEGRLIPVTLTVDATDAVDPAPKSKIVDVTCNQPAVGDWIITGDLTLKLRAQHTRSGTRIYTITVQCTDASGNATTGTVTVTVPK